ncbi:hypothetical protein ACF08W_29135 [Streptomyces sp. NPDC015144]|uniref:hypothetical protein n=1 Tax=Streptomyces sp. NPDC015144 TaxID=3364944 RepID=UPI0036FFA7F4
MYPIERDSHDSYPPRGETDGIHFVTSPHGEILTPYGTGYNVDAGGYVWLMDGETTAARLVIRTDRRFLEGEQEEAARELAPWARTVTHLDRARRYVRQVSQVERTLDDLDYPGPDDDPAAVYERLARLAVPEDRTPPADRPAWRSRPDADARELGARIRARLERLEREERSAALAALPAAEESLPVLPRGWKPWWPKSEGTWTDAIAETLFERWRASGTGDTRARDDLIRRVTDANISKSAVHRGTGIARTTIDRVLAAGEEAS